MTRDRHYPLQADVVVQEAKEEEEKDKIPPVPKTKRSNKQQQQQHRRAKSTPNNMANYIKQHEIPPDPHTFGTTTAPHLIWVPAHKHPQIAPSEFAAWIETYTAAHQEGEGRANSSCLRRQKSKLSTYYTSDQVEDDKTYVFDRYSTSEDLSPILVPRESRSLSRRSALSSRGRNAIRRKSLTTIEERRHSNHKEQQQQEQEPIPAGGIKLYDRPVNMSEWVDLGNAMEEDSTMLSRVHDVEAQVWTQPTKPTKRRNMNLPPPPPPPPHQQLPVTNEKKQPQQQQRKSLKQSFTLSKQKSNKWMGGLFKKNESNNNDDSSNNKKSGLGSLITRSLSLKSSNSSKRKKQHHHRLSQQESRSSPPPPTTTTTTIIPTMIKEGRERLPLHIERAIYHLSHVKLTNPKRPLHHQVMISNFMFWYLSIQQQQQQQQQQQFMLPPLPPQHHYQSVLQHGSLNMCSPQPC
ncbi:hypothetical protein O0I10_004202 [Lichtheimia ornata]|uniref:Protein Zds1 C-terminal domain-containing protein n=1 Tax=Lichtheimia ornata TaxID=688661 RepID=A0AAD7Y0G7_9FUNG|nr:uncharacterized protein O0I10_004202 [Lichtheimia ornata]KAJ8659976.1 hypothetical protein O0I10_004202 [Lichtheimia ornata]